MKKLNLNIKKDSSGPYMKTQAQMVQEEGVGMETPSVSVSRSVSGERENGTEEGSSVSTGDGNEIGRIGENNDTKMEEVEMEEELQASIEESGADDSEDELMVLDRL